jgi:uncharacterized protein (TIGR02145 family)
MKKIILGLLMVFVLGCTKDDKANETNTANLPSIKIGTQTWTTKNLDVTTYSDGTIIPEVTDQKQWAALTTGAWCYYNNDSANGVIYGKLYNWYAVAGIYNEASKTDASQRKKLAPMGYHVPSDTEWTTLTDYLGGETIAGGKMKEIGTTHWKSPNQDATNTSGFAARPGGYRDGNYLFHTIGVQINMWSSSDVGLAWARTMIYNTGEIFATKYSKIDGYSVRCLRD